MEKASLAGRVIVGLAFVAFGLMKVMGFSMVVGMLDGIGFPMASVFAVLLIVVELGGGILLVIGKQVQWVSYALIAVLVVATLTVHLDTSDIMGSLGPILQHIIMIGGLVIISGHGSESSAPAQSANTQM